MNDRPPTEDQADLVLPPTSLLPARTSGAPGAGREWEHVLRALTRNWAVAGVFGLLTVGIVAAANLYMRPVYAPTARLEIDPPGSEPFSMRDSVNAQSDDQDYFNTQAQILKSDELALAVIRSLKLDRELAIVGPELIAYTSRPGKEPSPSGVQLTYLESIALEVLQSRLSVNTVRNTRLVEVSFTCHDPVLAATVTNTTVDLFIDRNFQTRYKATIQASEWLSGQLSDLRRIVERTNQVLVDYQKKNGILDVEDNHNPVAEKLVDLNRQLIQAEADRVQLEAEEKMVASGSADALPEVQNNAVIQALTQKYAEGRAQLADALTVFGENSPTVKRLQSQVAELTAQLSSERQRTIRELEARYAAAVAREQLMSRAVDGMGLVINDTNQKMVRYKALKEDALANAQLYNSLLARLKEAGISAGLKSSSMRVVDHARILNRPTGPHRLRNIALGLVLGLAGGAALALLKEGLNTTARTAEDVTHWTGLRTLGALPLVSSTNGRRLRLPIRNGRRLATPDASAISARRLFLDRPESIEAEAVRSLRTAIMLRHRGKAPRVLLVASPSRWEGKTTVAVNLALALARQARTCLIDGDLRRPSVAQTFGLPSEPGLSNALTGSYPLQALLRPVPELPQLMVLPAGPTTLNRELVASEPVHMTLRSARELFEFVVLDSPPIIPFADARVLSALADGVILVVRTGCTTRRDLTKAVQELSAVNAPWLGVVVNGTNLDSRDYSSYYDGLELATLAESDAWRTLRAAVRSKGVGA